MRRALEVAAFVALLVAVWQGLYHLSGEVALSAPYETARHLVVLLGSDRFWPHAAETGLAFLYSLAIAAGGGMTIGLVLGLHRLSGQVAEPILISIYSLPKVTLYPVILLLFGLGLSAKVAFGALHGIIPITIFTMAAVRTVSPVLVKTARIMRLDRWSLVRSVIVPAALPEIVTGLRVGFSLTLLGVLIGEMFASQRGLGFLIMNAIGLHDVTTMLAVTLLLVIVAVAANSALLALDRKMHHRAA